jgi:uncharacterized protein
VERNQSNARGSDASITLFIALAFLLSWGIWLPMIWAGQSVRPGSLPTHFLGLIGPAFAALLTASVLGKSAVGDLAYRLTRIPWAERSFWVLLMSPILFVGAAMTAAVVLGQQVNFAGLHLYSGLLAWNLTAVSICVLFINGFGEEVGWRGFLLPRLQLRLGPIMGTVCTTIVWSTWHAPLFWLI